VNTAKGQVTELILQNGFRYARITCPVNLTPSPGQYLLSSNASFSDLLPVPLFSTESTPLGFIAAVPEYWSPGQEISLRGPLGRGFVFPPSARKVALISFDDSPARLRGLIKPALKQGAAVVLVCDSSQEDSLPDEVEVQPLSALDDVVRWADYVAFDVLRESLHGLKERLGGMNQPSVKSEAQVLVRTSIPCGGIAECGVCAVGTKSSWKLACKDGPVFDWNEL
jgi:NAD(P)H-flavin reductase